MIKKNTKNIAYTCISEPCLLGYASYPAFTWIRPDLSEEICTCEHIEHHSNQIANILKNQGIEKGDCISIFLPKSPELINSFFGILKNEAVACILFSTFGENALFDRLTDSCTKIVITKKTLLKRVLKIKSDLKSLKLILVTDLDQHLDEFVLSMPQLMQEASVHFSYPAETDPETPALIQYTSGSTGKPKGVLHVHAASTAMFESYREVFNLQPDEIYWCTADPAWITGIVYGIIAPLGTMTRLVQFSGSFETPAWLSILQNKKISVWYTAPTALRMLMQEESTLFHKYDYSHLRRIYSVGEPLNPIIYHWAKKVFGCEIYDTWFQSETGSIMIGNKPGTPVKPGSMGKPLNRIQACIMNDDMKPLAFKQQGYLCLKKDWPSMFRMYIHKKDSYQEKFKEDLYISGDLAFKDEDGYFWYVSRSDDIINTAGHLVGPFEVESALLEIDEIMDAAVIGAPDELLHEKIVAFLCLKNTSAWSRALELKCRVMISNKISTTAIPQEYILVHKIPKNKSGKILRRVLKAQYEKKDPGDLSSMEE